MFIDSRQLDALVSQVRNALASSKAKISAIGDEQLRRTHLTSFAVLERAVESWSTTQRDQVLAGTREPKRWIDYGNELIADAEWRQKEAGVFAVAFSRLANTLGDLAQWLKSHWDDVLKKVDELNAKLKVFEKAVAALRKDREVFQGRKLPDSLQTAFFGTEAENALSSFEKFRTTLQGVNTAVSLVKTGKARLEKQGEDIAVVPVSGLGAMTLGAVPLVVVGGILGVVAGLAVVASALDRVFRFIEQARADATYKRELELIASNPGAAKAVTDLKKAQAELEDARSKNQPTDPITGFVKVAKVVGGVVVVGAGAWGLKQLVDAVRGMRREA